MQINKRSTRVHERCLERTCVIFQNRTNRIDGVMVRVLRSCAVDHGFESDINCYYNSPLHT